MLFFYLSFYFKILFVFYSTTLHSGFFPELTCSKETSPASNTFVLQIRDVLKISQRYSFCWLYFPSQRLCSKRTIKNRTLTLIESVSGAVDGRVGYCGTWRRRKEVISVNMPSVFVFYLVPNQCKQVGVPLTNDSVCNMQMIHQMIQRVTYEGFIVQLTMWRPVRKWLGMQLMNDSACNLQMIHRMIQHAFCKRISIQLTNDSLYKLQIIQ